MIERLLIALFGKQLNAMVSRELCNAYSSQNIRSAELHVLANRFGYLFRRPGFTDPKFGRAVGKVYEAGDAIIPDSIFKA